MSFFEADISTEVPDEAKLDAIEWQENDIPGSMLKDQKPHWMAKGPYFSEIHFKIIIGEKDFIWVFGEGDAKNPLEQAIFFIDYNAKAAITPDPIRNGTIYTPTPNRAVSLQLSFSSQMTLFPHLLKNIITRSLYSSSTCHLPTIPSYVL